MNIKTNLFTGLLCASLLSACAPDSENTAAIVNGTRIEKKTYQAALDNAVVQQKQANPNFADNEQNRLILGRLVLENLITSEVLAQEAAKARTIADAQAVEQNLQKIRQVVTTDGNGKPLPEAEADKKFQEKLKTDGITLQQLKNNIQKELNANLFLQDLSSKQKVELSEDQIRRFYDATMAIVSDNKKAVEALSKEDLALLLPFAAEVKKNTAARASVSSIFLSTRGLKNDELTKKKESAKKITQELKDKKITFIDAIQKYSDDKAALRTNGEQVVLKGTLPADLDKKVFEASLGKVVGPLTEQDGIYILRVNEKRAETTLAYIQLRNDIIKYLAQIQIKQKVQQQTKDLVAKADVKILLPQYQVNTGEKAK